MIIPCFNDGRTLDEAVRSVGEQEPCELAVVDDGSSDPETALVLKRLAATGVKVIRLRQNRGVAAARMAGLEATSAPYVFPLDADDYLQPRALTRLADHLDRNPDLSAVWGRYRIVGDRDHVPPVATYLDPWTITYFNDLAPALFRRSALLAVGGWSLKRGYEDWDLWMSLAENGCGGQGLPTEVYCYRAHGPRGYSRHRRHHEDLLRDFRRRHARLFSQRSETRRRSRVPRRLKFVMVAVDTLPIFSGYQKMYTYGIAAHFIYRRGGYGRIARLLFAASCRAAKNRAKCLNRAWVSPPGR